MSGIFILIGTAVLVASVLVGWYQITATGSATESGSTVTVGGSAMFYPLDVYSVSFTCSGSNQCFTNQTTTGPYSQGAFTSLGTLYDVVAALVLLAIGVGVLAAVLAFLTRGNRYPWSTGLVVLAVLLALVAPVVLFADQPSALSSQSSASSGPSPRTSFFGSCSGNGCGESLAVGETESGSWGPFLGWYLSFLSVVPLFVGLLSLRSPKGRFPGIPTLEFAN